MEFLVSYKVVKRCIQTYNIVENIDSLVLDNKSTPKHPIDYKNVVDKNVLAKWGTDICNKERFENEYEYTILKYSILSFCKLGIY